MVVAYPKSRIRVRLRIQTHLYFPPAHNASAGGNQRDPKTHPNRESEVNCARWRREKDVFFCGRNERWWTMPNTASRSGLIFSVLSIVQGRCILLTIPSHSTIELRSWRKLPNLYFQQSIHPSTLTHRSPAHMSRNHHIERLTAITHTRARLYSRCLPRRVTDYSALSRAGGLHRAPVRNLGVLAGVAVEEPSLGAVNVVSTLVRI
jgi:hypothetical protein